VNSEESTKQKNFTSCNLQFSNFFEALLLLNVKQQHGGRFSIMEETAELLKLGM
jgi:hypothetical protein